MEFDRKAIETAVTSGLPVHARWLIDGTPLDFDFSIAGRGLRGLPAEVIEAGDAGASDLLVFGEQDFAEGGGARPWLCIRKPDGSVSGFDPEREGPIFPLNSSIEQFVATFRLLNEHLGKNEQLPSDCESRLRAIDPEAYPSSDWRLLVECLRNIE
jgi:hypothetical protein